MGFLRSIGGKIIGVLVTIGLVITGLFLFRRHWKEQGRQEAREESFRATKRKIEGSKKAAKKVGSKIKDKSDLEVREKMSHSRYSR